MPPWLSWLEVEEADCGWLPLLAAVEEAVESWLYEVFWAEAGLDGLVLFSIVVIG